MVLQQSLWHNKGSLTRRDARTLQSRAVLFLFYYEDRRRSKLFGETCMSLSAHTSLAVRGLLSSSFCGEFR